MDEEPRIEPRIEQRVEQPYAGITAFVTMQTLGTELPERLAEVFGWLNRRGITPAGPPFFRYVVVDMSTRLEVEVGVPVAEPVDGDETVRPGVLPSGRYLTRTHVGHPQGLGKATGELLDWAAAHDLAWDMTPGADGERWGCRLEIYHSDPEIEPDLDRWRTELAFRLRD